MSFLHYNVAHTHAGERKEGVATHLHSFFCGYAIKLRLFIAFLLMFSFFVSLLVPFLNRNENCDFCGTSIATIRCKKPFGTCLREVHEES